MCPLQEVWELLFANLVPYSVARTDEHLLPWKILQHATEQKMTKYLSRACGTWAKDGLLKPSILKVLKSYVGTGNNDHAWLLLSLVTVYLPLQDPHFVMDYFKGTIHTPQGVGLYTLLQVLRVLFASVARLSQEERHLLQSDLVLLIRRFALPPELIPTAVDIATVVSDLEAGGGGEGIRGTDAYAKRYQSKLDGWAAEIVETIDDELSSKILNPAGDEVENLRMMRQIFTLGELAQICPHRINKRLFLLMQSIIFQQVVRGGLSSIEIMWKKNLSYTFTHLPLRERNIVAAATRPPSRSRAAKPRAPSPRPALSRRQHDSRRSASSPWPRCVSSTRTWPRKSSRPSGASS